MKTKLCVLFGGKSVEHEISVISALQAMENLDTAKYDLSWCIVFKVFHTNASFLHIF